MLVNDNQDYCEKYFDAFLFWFNSTSQVQNYIVYKKWLKTTISFPKNNIEKGNYLIRNKHIPDTIPAHEYKT